MSHPASNWALYFADCPSASARYVLMILADAHNGADDRCFPSVATICGLSGLSERAVYACLKQLEEAGIITRKKLVHSNGRQMGVEYDLHMQFHVMRPEAPEGMKRKHVAKGGVVGEGAYNAAPKEGASNAGETASGAGEGVHQVQPSKGNRERENRKEHTLSADADREPQEEAYPIEFESLWIEVPKTSDDPLANPGSKAKAYASWRKLSKAQKEACWLGWQSYLEVMQERRKKRPDYPFKQLVAWINGREWETYGKDAA